MSNADRNGILLFCHGGNHCLGLNGGMETVQAQIGTL